MSVGFSKSVGAMTADDFKSLVRDAVREEFILCGILASTPAEQIEAQDDFRFLRQFRKFYRGLVNKVGNAVVLAAVAFIIGLIALGFNFRFGR